MLGLLHTKDYSLNGTPSLPPLRYFTFSLSHILTIPVFCSVPLCMLFLFPIYKIEIQVSFIGGLFSSLLRMACYLDEKDVELVRSKGTFPLESDKSQKAMIAY